jgi:hypothetical protein
MKVNCHLSPWTEHAPGKLALIPQGNGYAYGLAVLWERGDVGFVILDGDRAGELDGAYQDGAFAYEGQAELCLSKQSSDWHYVGPPKAPIVVAIAGNQSYFIFKLNNEYFAVDAATGTASRAPRFARFTHVWSIRETGEDKPFIQSRGLGATS